MESFEKAADLVGFYLKEMGSFRLLSRGGDVEIAKRIESGQKEMRRKAKFGGNRRKAQFVRKGC